MYTSVGRFGLVDRAAFTIAIEATLVEKHHGRAANLEAKRHLMRKPSLKALPNLAYRESNKWLA